MARTKPKQTRLRKGVNKYTEELYKKAPNGPNNYNGLVIHLEPDILECEVKWALGSITRNKASGGDEIPAELLQILKDDAVKVLHSYASKFGKLSSGPRTGKKSVTLPIQKKGNAKECSHYCSVALISHASNIMPQILQASLAVREPRPFRCTNWI